MAGGKFSNISDVLNKASNPEDDIDLDLDMPEEEEETPLEEREYYKKAQEMREKFLALKDGDDSEFKKEILKMTIQTGLEFEAIALAEYTDAPRAFELQHIASIRTTTAQAIKELETISNNKEKMDLEKAKLLLKKKELEIREQKMISEGAKDPDNPTVIKDSNVLFVGDTNSLIDAMESMKNGNSIKSVPTSGA